jgi:hypothetical protein
VDEGATLQVAEGRAGAGAKLLVAEGRHELGSSLGKTEGVDAGTGANNQSDTSPHLDHGETVIIHFCLEAY